jgi:hypothetical protein
MAQLLLMTSVNSIHGISFLSWHLEEMLSSLQSTPSSFFSMFPSPHASRQPYSML